MPTQEELTYERVRLEEFMNDWLNRFERITDEGIKKLRRALIPYCKMCNGSGIFTGIGNCSLCNGTGRAVVLDP